MKKIKTGLAMGGRGYQHRGPPPCRFWGDGGIVLPRTHAPQHGYVALQCRITCIMDTRLLSVINALQVQGVLCPPFVGRAAPILRELQPGIVVLGSGRRLFDGDGVLATAH